MESVHELWNRVKADVQMTVPFDLDAATQVVFRVGSHSHGTYVPPEDPNGVDDVDLMVVVVPPPEFKLGLKSWEHGTYKHGKWDVVLYDWQKYLHMVSKSNPNVLGTLWLEGDDVCRFSEAFTVLQGWRHEFLSRRMYPAFVGYARGQLYKMTHHAHQGYMGDKRKQLVEKFGYDVKNAAHLIRLLRMACEAFELGTLFVRRPDAAEIIGIKQGLWSLERVQKEAENLFTRVDHAVKNGKVREVPNELLLQTLMVTAYKENWWWDEYGE